MHEEIGRLPERYRRAVVLCHLEGLTHAQAARRLGCAPGTVGSLVSRARDMLRNRLTRRGLSAGAIALAGSLESGAGRGRGPDGAGTGHDPGRLSVRDRAGGGRRHRLGGGRGTGRRSTQDHDAEQAGDRGVVGGGLVAVATAAGGLAAGISRSDEPRPTRAQEEPRKGAASAPAPHLPGAVTQPPPWLDRNAPFDVAAFFAAPPPEQNAAPLYLDAFFEFDSGMAVCFPDGPDREGRKRAADARAAPLQVP